MEAADDELVSSRPAEPLAHEAIVRSSTSRDATQRA